MPTLPVRRGGSPGTLSRAQSEPVYRYLFTHAMERGPDAPLGAFHILSQFFLFGRYQTYPYQASDAGAWLVEAASGVLGPLHVGKSQRKRHTNVGALSARRGIG